MYEITPLDKISFGADGNLAMIQNAKFILSTHIGTCFMDREFGWEPPIDAPNEYAKTEASARIVEVLERNIPGLTVEEVLFDEDVLTGRLVPRVKVVIEDGQI